MFRCAFGVGGIGVLGTAHGKEDLGRLAMGRVLEGLGAEDSGLCAHHVLEAVRSTMAFAGPAPRRQGAYFQSRKRLACRFSLKTLMPVALRVSDTGAGMPGQLRNSPFMRPVFGARSDSARPGRGILLPARRCRKQLMHIACPTALRRARCRAPSSSRSPASALRWQTLRGPCGGIRE